MDWKHWVPSPLHLQYPWDGKIQLIRGEEKDICLQAQGLGLSPDADKAGEGVERDWLQPVVLWAVMTTLHSLRKKVIVKKYFKNSTCYFWFSPNLTLNSLLWIWKLSDNVVNQYIDAACIICSENHMGGGRNHFWLQYMGRTSSSWGQSASHHHLRRSSKHLRSLPWQQEMLQNHSDTATAYCS